MRIENIDLKNFKQFQDFSIEFPSKDNEKNDFHVIVGKMGVGKSNFLESINWCLYGKEIFKNISKPTDEIVLNSNCLKTDGTHIVKVKLVLSDENYKYLIIRDSKFKVSNGEVFSLNETSLSFSKDMGLISKDNDAKSKINNLLPEDLRDHFFFNGERLDNYFDKTQGEKISLVIKKMAGIDVLEKFKNLLERVEDKYRRQIKVNDNNIRRKIEVEDELTKIKNKKEEAKRELEKSKIDLDDVKIELDKVNSSLDKLKEFENIKKREEELKEQRNYLQEQKNKNLKEKIQRILDLGTLVFGWNALENVYHKNVELKISYDFLPKDIIKKALDENKCPICENELDDEHRDLLKKSLDFSQNFTISASQYNNLLNDISNLKSYLDEKNLELGEIEKKLNKINNEMKNIEKNVSELKNNELEELYLKKKQIEAQKDHLSERIGSLKNQIEFLETEERNKEEEINKLATKDSKIFVKKINFVKEIEQIILNTIVSRLEDIKKEIISYTKEYIDKLMWKKDLIVDLDFNENFSLNVYDKYGNMILNRLSGGERSVLTLSFALAMHKASGVDAPIVIDRPLTNISGESYEKMIEVIANISKEKQIIIMLTDREYQDLVELLNKLAASIFILEMDEDSNVYITDKYFNEVI